MLHPDRIVLGELDNSSGNMMETLVRKVYDSNQPPILRTNLTTAEMIKYASNAFLATKIAFINEIAGLCEQFESVDVQKVADGMGYDRRIGRAFLNAGLGFGGSCLPKDLKAFVRGARQNGTRLRIAEAALASNELQPLRLVRLAWELIGNLKGRKAAVLGLAYKPGTSDMKDAQSVEIIRALLDRKVRVSVYDPKAMGNAVAYFGKKVRYAKDVRDCLKGSDCCFIVTEWSEFKEIDSDLLMDTMNPAVLLDPRRVLDPSKLHPKIIYRTTGLR
jgi:UDPglucose 6-dehydrogenase